MLRLIGAKARLCLLVLGASVVGCANVSGPSEAVAAKVSVLPGDLGWTVDLRSARGEPNAIAIRVARDGTILVRDSGSSLDPKSPDCVAIDAHTARCASPPPPSGGRREPLQQVVARLGDRPDRLRVVSHGGANFYGVLAHGGAGADRLMAGSGDDRLDGGRGRDRLRGGLGANSLQDGDHDPDVLDGGPDDGDSLSFADRSDGVTADLRTGRTVDGDVLRGLENLEGSDGADRLAGDRRRNILAGGDGPDTLVARGSHDWPAGGAGADVVSCGGGRERHLHVDDARDVFAADCESLGMSEEFVTVPVRPWLRSSTDLLYPVLCPHRMGPDGPSGRRVRCAWTITMRDAARPHRVLARRNTAPGAWDGDLLRLALTAAGRSTLRAGTGSVLMRIVRRGPRSARKTLAWTTPVDLRRWATPMDLEQPI